MSLRVGKGNDGCVEESESEAEDREVAFAAEKARKSGGGGGGGSGGAAMNTTKHLWAGVVAAMVSRFIINLHFEIE